MATSDTTSGMELKMNVAAVCGDEVRIYGAISREPPYHRPFIWRKKLSTHGAALLFASEYEEMQHTKVVAQRSEVTKNNLT